MAKKKTSKKKKKKPVKLTKALVKKFAFECENMIEADLKVNENISTRIKRSGAFQKAWDRGRMLRDLGRFACKGTSKPDTAAALDMTPGELDEMLKTDVEAADIWIRSRRKGRIQLQTGIYENALDGKGQALKSLERIFQEDNVEKVGNNFRVDIKQMCAIAGVSRQTLHDWYSNKGMPINGDNTFDLRAERDWYTGFVQRKVKVNPKVMPTDELRDMKTEEKRRELLKDAGLWLERNKVMAGFLARAQQIMTLWERLAPEAKAKMAELPEAGVSEIFDAFRDELLELYCTVDIDLKLEPELEREFEKLLKKIMK